MRPFGIQHVLRHMIRPAWLRHMIRPILNIIMHTSLDDNDLLGCSNIMKPLKNCRYYLYLFFFRTIGLYFLCVPKGSDFVVVWLASSTTAEIEKFLCEAEVVYILGSPKFLYLHIVQRFGEHSTILAKRKFRMISSLLVLLSIYEKDIIPFV